MEASPPDPLRADRPAGGAGQAASAEARGGDGRDPALGRRGMSQVAARRPPIAGGGPQGHRAVPSEMDVIGAFLQDECEIGPGHKDPFSTLYKRYEEGGERAETRRKFHARLKERGKFEARRSGPGGANEWHGLRLLKKQNSVYAGKLKKQPENTYNSSETTTSRDEGEKNFSSSVASVGTPASQDLTPGESVTVEQLQRIRELKRQGFSERSARIEVLAKD